MFGSTDSNIIVYSNKKLVVNADNYVVNGQEAFNFTIPDLIGNGIFNKIDEADIPFTEVIPDVQYEVKDKKELSKKVKTTIINSVLSFNTSTNLVEYAGAVNHTDTSLATYKVKIISQKEPVEAFQAFKDNATGKYSNIVSVEVGEQTIEEK